MPFDGVSVQTTLSERLAKIGIHPIDIAVLDKHMADQKARYPGSWAYYHHKLLADTLNTISMLTIVALITSLVGTVFSAICKLGPANLAVDFAFQLCAGSLVFFALILLGCFCAADIQVTAPATWVTYDLCFTNYKDMNWPAPVNAMLQYIEQSGISGDTMTITYGELRQNTVLLDPFIVVQHNYETEKHVLAIWDGDTILHIA